MSPAAARRDHTPAFIPPEGTPCLCHGRGLHTRGFVHRGPSQHRPPCGLGATREGLHHIMVSITSLVKTIKILFMLEKLYFENNLTSYSKMTIFLFVRLQMRIR